MGKRKVRGTNKTIINSGMLLKHASPKSMFRTNLVTPNVASVLKCAVVIITLTSRSRSSVFLVVA